MVLAEASIEEVSVFAPPLVLDRFGVGARREFWMDNA